MAKTNKVNYKMNVTRMVKHIMVNHPTELDSFMEVFTYERKARGSEEVMIQVINSRGMRKYFYTHYHNDFSGWRGVPTTVALQVRRKEKPMKRGRKAKTEK